MWSSSPTSVGDKAESPRGTVVVDAVGVGGGVSDRLREIGYRVEEFNAGGSPSEPSRFLNARAEAYWKLRKQLEAGGVGLPDDEKLADELLSVRWRSTPDGRIRLEAKDELRGRLGRSPDRADAVVMAFAKVERSPRLVWSR